MKIQRKVGSRKSLILIWSLTNLSRSGAVKTCFDISTHTNNECVDVPGFVDAGGYDCASNAGIDCWVDNLGYGYTEAQATEVFTACPSSCSLCTSKKIEVEIIDASTNASPVYLKGTTYTGVGGAFNSLPSLITTSIFCVATPSCLKARMVVSGSESQQVQLLSRGAFVISETTTSTTIVSVSGSDETVEFCKSDCLPGNIYNSILRECVQCEAGSFANSIFSTKCELCPSNTYSDIGNADCTTCP